MSFRPIRRALLSVHDKTGLVELGRRLAAKGVELVSTGGTAAALRAADVPVVEVGDLTGAPEILDGRVKTLHPASMAGSWPAVTMPAHLATLAEHGLAPIDLVVVNLYPFEATIASGADFAACIEQIDVGGPAMIRAAAKNHDGVAVVVEPADYEMLLAAVEAGGTEVALRRRLAAKAFARTAAYDAHHRRLVRPRDRRGVPRARRSCAGTRRSLLRYGENPHQRAAFYATGGEPMGLARGAAAPGQGALLQQPQRHRHGAGHRGRLRRARRRHHQARQPLRRGRRR